MSIRTRLSAMVLTAATAWAGCDPNASTIGPPPDRRECPHDWPQELTFSAREGGEMTVSATLNGPGPIRNVPEFHDCQRFLVRDGSNLRYDSLFAIFATERLARLDTLELVSSGRSVEQRPEGDTDQELTGSESLPAAEIVAWNDYAPLHIETGFNCLYLYRKSQQGQDGGWGAVMVSFGTTEQDCSRAAGDPSTLPGAQPLSVRHYPDSLLTAATDFPPAARWDWDDARNRHYIGIRCGIAWCGVGETGFTPSRTYASQVQNASGVLPEYRVMQIKGWYDEQVLAGPPATDGSPRPTSIVGTLIPHPDLAQMDSASFQGSWVVTSYVALRVTGSDNPYLSKFNLAATTPGDRLSQLNTVALCHGTESQCDLSTTDPPTSCGDGLWWARVTNADDGSQEYFCVTHYPVNMTIPGIVRWRWLVEDEGKWMRCPFGCCELTGTF